MFGGREAEALMFEEISVGAQADLAGATSLARAMVTELGMAPDGVGVQRVAVQGNREPAVSDMTLGRVDEAIRAILERERARAAKILRVQQKLLEALRDLLVERKVIDRAGMAALLPTEREVGTKHG
jgi:cell division protease FtsH